MSCPSVWSLFVSFVANSNQTRSQFGTIRELVTKGERDNYYTCFLEKEEASSLPFCFLVLGVILDLNGSKLDGTKEREREKDRPPSEKRRRYHIRHL